MELVDIMELSMVVYMATNAVNGKVYIGRTVGLLGYRIGKHKHSSNKSGFYFYRAIRKYGWDVFEWEVLEQCDTEEELNDLEYHYIQQYRRFGKGVYNMTDGGDGMSGFVFSEESKQKMSKAHKGVFPSEETRKKLSDSQKGRVFSEESKQKMSISQKGKVLSEETKKKLSDSKRGEKHPNYGKRGEKHPFSKRYVIMFPDGSVMEIVGMKEFCRQNNLHKGAMLDIATGKRGRKSYKGFKCWLKEDAPVPEQPIVIPSYDYNTPVFDLFF